uniref:Uncharacterized protein n=1 Tax=uncultured marine virus TaxID=186617 RepID=A0A0F7L5C0_9VIRU|nr:hypothetical protein [uncultured marine virus]
MREFSAFRHAMRAALRRGENKPTNESTDSLHVLRCFPTSLMSDSRISRRRNPRFSKCRV